MIPIYDAVQRLKTRVEVQGFWHTLGYLVFTVFLERFRVSLNYVFEAEPSQKFKPLSECRLEAVTSMAALGESTLGALARYGGERILREFEGKFPHVEACILVHMPDGRFAGAAWLRRADQRYLPANDRPCVRFESCFTLPEFRGRGVFSSALAFGRSWLYARMVPTPALYIECSVFNTSSRRGILRAGFQERGVLLLVRKWGRYFPRRAVQGAPSS